VDGEIDGEVMDGWMDGWVGGMDGWIETERYRSIGIILLILITWRALSDKHQCQQLSNIQFSLQELSLVPMPAGRSHLGISHAYQTEV
jgi:hypothetical protein